MSGLIESTKEASRGGFRGVKKVRGLLTEIKLVPPRFETSDFGGEPKRQAEVTLLDTQILAMFLGEEAFEFKDGKYVFWLSYAAEGKTPHANSAYIKCWVASAEKLGKKPSDFIGSYVTLDKVPVVLFKKPKIGEDKKPSLGEDGKKVYEDVVTADTFSFVPDEEEGSDAVDNYICNLIVCLNQKAALHKLLVDTRAKNYPDYKRALSDGTLAEKLGLVITNGVFQVSEKEG